MASKSLRMRLLSAAGLSVAVGLTAMPSTAFADGIEEITVTAQRRAESLQTVPIAVTAFDASALEAKQIDTFSDLQFNTPNVNFTKTNFTGSSFQIRGIGANLTAQSGDAGTGIHVNDAPLQSSGLFETEYYDIERMEVLRGPQGTLYGRNSTGGAVNMVTKKPVMGEYEGNVDFQYGNYDHTRLTGAFNLPLGEKMALRLAGIYLVRDGYTHNLHTGNDIDGRDQNSWRGSFRWQMGDNTTIDFIYSQFEEDSTRSRSQKQMCLKDPLDMRSMVLGCLPDGLGFDLPHTSALAFNLLATQEVLGGAVSPLAAPFGTGYIGVDGNAGITGPSDMRTVNMDFEPEYYREDTFKQFQFQHEFDTMTFTALSTWNDSMLSSRQDYDLAVGNPFGPMLGSAAGWAPEPFFAAHPLVDGGGAFTSLEAAAVLEQLMLGVTGNPAFLGTYTQGLFPISAISATDNGLLGGDIMGFYSDFLSYDQSGTDSEQFTQELRLSSNYDGSFNFLAGLFYMDYDNSGDYHVVQHGLDHFAAVVNGMQFLGGAPAGVVTFPGPYFRSHTQAYNLKSKAAFGELYFEPSDDFKITMGLRYTHDEKTIADRNPIFAALGADCALNPTVFPADPCPPLNRDAEEWKELTGRIGFDWQKDEDTMYYGFFSRGYKGGGFNPNFTEAQKQLAGANPPTRFDPEFINAFEVGTKTTWFDGTLRANMSAFHYDYEGMQFTNIILNTSVNENIDATIWGLEGEFLWVPSDNWQFDLNLSYLNTEVASKHILDTRDPTGGQADVTVFADMNAGTIAGNCVLIHPGAPNPLTVPAFAPFFPSGPFTNCVTLKNTIAPLLPGYEFAFGQTVDVGGNKLAYSPETSLKFGVQRTSMFSDGAELAIRVDYFWQDDMSARIQNGPADAISNWSTLNASIQYSSSEGDWYAKAFVQNAFDDDNVTGKYLGSPSTGLFTNVFTMEPRLAGVQFGAKF